MVFLEQVACVGLEATLDDADVRHSSSWDNGFVVRFREQYNYIVRMISKHRRFCYPVNPYCTDAH